MQTKTAKTPAKAPAPTRKRRTTPIKKTSLELKREFAEAPLEALLTTGHLAAHTDKSEAAFERDRWSGVGAPFVKLGRSVRYRKADFLAYLEARIRLSTTGTTDSQ